MKTEEKLSLVIGATLVIGSISAMVYLNRLVEKANERSHEREEAFMQKEWEEIQKLKFFEEATPEERIEYYNAFWKTEGGRK